MITFSIQYSKKVPGTEISREGSDHRTKFYLVSERLHLEFKWGSHGHQCISNTSNRHDEIRH